MTSRVVPREPTPSMLAGADAALGRYVPAHEDWPGTIRLWQAMYDAAPGAPHAGEDEKPGARCQGVDIRCGEQCSYVAGHVGECVSLSNMDIVPLAAPAAPHADDAARSPVAPVPDAALDADVRWLQECSRIEGYERPLRVAEAIASLRQQVAELTAENEGKRVIVSEAVSSLSNALVRTDKAEAALAECREAVERIAYNMTQWAEPRRQPELREWAQVLRAAIAKQAEGKPPPYPFCLTPEKCAGLSSCPRDPNCSD
jgi:hypothetical protein